MRLRDAKLTESKRFKVQGVEQFRLIKLKSISKKVGKVLFYLNLRRIQKQWRNLNFYLFMQGVRIGLERDVSHSRRQWMGMHGETTPSLQITDACMESEIIYH